MSPTAPAISSLLTSPPLKAFVPPPCQPVVAPVPRRLDIGNRPALPVGDAAGAFNRRLDVGERVERPIAAAGVEQVGDLGREAVPVGVAQVLRLQRLVSEIQLVEGLAHIVTSNR